MADHPVQTPDRPDRSALTDRDIPCSRCGATPTPYFVVGRQEGSDEYDAVAHLCATCVRKAEAAAWESTRRMARSLAETAKALHLQPDFDPILAPAPHAKGDE